MDSLSLFSTITLHDIQLELQYKVRPQCSSARTKIHTIDRTTLVPQWFGPLHLIMHCNFLFDGYKDDRKVYFLLSGFSVSPETCCSGTSGNEAGHVSVFK